MQQKIVVLGLIILVMAFSCSRKADVAIVSQDWIANKKACNGSRLLSVEQMKLINEKLLKASEEEIREVFGKPDRHQLYVRSQKFYTYYLEPGPECKGGSEHPQCLFVRFDALGRANSFEYRSL